MCLFIFSFKSEGMKTITVVKGAKENLIFLFLNQNICCGYSKEPSQ